MDPLKLTDCICACGCGLQWKQLNPPVPEERFAMMNHRYQQPQRWLEQIYGIQAKLAQNRGKGRRKRGKS